MIPVNLNVFLVIFRLIASFGKAYTGRVIISSTFTKVSPLGIKQCANMCLQYSGCLSILYSKLQLECRLNYMNETLMKYVPSEYETFMLIKANDFRQVLQFWGDTSRNVCPSSKRRIVTKKNVTYCIPFRIVGTEPTENVALGKSTQQSSIYEQCVSSHAVDGRLDRAYQQCTHTRKEYKSWWMVDLGGPYYIHKINLFNRDFLGERLNNFGVYTGLDAKHLNMIAYYEGHAESLEIVTFVFPYPQQGQYVQIMLLNEEVLTLCEVEIYANI